MASVSRRRYAGLFGVAVAYAVASTYSLALMGVHLEPDSSCYLRGSCAWSSPIDAVLGRLGGMSAVAAASAFGICVLGLAVAWWGSAVRSLVLLALLLVLPGYTGLAAGPDAIGAAAAVAAWRWRGCWPLVAAVHLEAVLCVGLGALARRFGLSGPQLVPLLGGCGAVAALALIGLLRHEPPSHSELRYLLPGGAIVATYGTGA